MQRDEDSEAGFTGNAVLFNQAAMLVDDMLRNGESEAGASRFAADHRVKDSIAQAAGNAGAVVSNINAANHPVTLIANGDLTLGTGFYADARHWCLCVVKRL